MSSLNLSLVVKWAIYAALTVGIGALFYQRFFPPLVDEGKPVPPLIAQLDNGEQLDLSQPNGTLTVLNFWGTYCGPCRQEGPVLSRLHAQLQRVGGRVVGIAVDNMPLSAVTRAARGFGMTYPIGLASQQDMSRFKVTTIPTTYIIDGKGIIRDAMVGAVSERRLQRVLKAAVMR